MNSSRLIVFRLNPLYQQSYRILARRLTTRNLESLKIENQSYFPRKNCYRLLSVYTPLFSQNEQTNSMPISERIEKMVKNKKIVIFMKGVPDQPMCGFSNAVVQVLRMHGVEDYDSHNVLEDEELRQGIKEFSDWPTIPQVYFEGDFIGGCDILLQMHQSGDLVDELEKLGIKSALVK
uniref:glutaredoxin-related protein 5, mitochondrial-like n=1 Tax=Styela clava TaxID=7725 RepID=UPI00193A576B|nr:glutaredoxin-related protein 5, mitochondrial-like [Styela clava]